MTSTLDPQSPKTRRTSATFSQDARFIAANNAAPDTLLSADDVLFYVHRTVISRSSANNLAGLIVRPSPSAVRIQVNAPTLTIMLCKMYNIALPETYDWPTLARAVEAIGSTRYALPPLSASEPLYSALLAHVNRPGGASDVFGLGAHHALEALAVAASEYLLSLDLSTIDDAWARYIGPAYLRRLFFLHLGRVDALKRILSVPPPAHAATAACGAAERERNVLVPWQLDGAQVVLRARADTPNSQIEAALNPIADRCPCVECSHAVTARIQAVLLEWSAIKRTI